ncbi:MAG: hypothetical protein GXP33_02260 [Spirochaetes bacterium]|nr:hypothetical protein [Spirochaetota bacterium]
MLKRLILGSVLAAALLISSVSLVFADSSWISGTTDQKIDSLAKIQPGLGTVMIEYGDRIGNMYYAAQAGNWGMAAYQLKEALEIQEVGEMTRPGKAPLLVSFEKRSLKPLAWDIVNKNFKSFQQDFKGMVKGCNACHAATGYGYIAYQLPDKPAVPAKLRTNVTVTRDQLMKLLKDLVSE